MKAVGDKVPSRRLSVSLLLLTSFVASFSWAQEPIPYQVTSPDTFQRHTYHGARVYDGLDWGDFDPEKMPEVYPSAIQDTPPEPVVIMYSAPAPVVEVEVGVMPARERPLLGEDKVFQEIEEDLQLQRCFFGSDDGRCAPITADDLEVLIEDPSSPSDLTGRFYQKLQALEEEISDEERFQLLERSFETSLEVVFPDATSD